MFAIYVLLIKLLAARYPTNGRAKQQPQKIKEGLAFVAVSLPVALISNDSTWLCLWSNLHVKSANSGLLGPFSPRVFGRDLAKLSR